MSILASLRQNIGLSRLKAALLTRKNKDAIKKFLPTSALTAYREYHFLWKNLHNIRMNVKQMGYQIGKQLAEERLGRVVDQPDGSLLDSKLCTQRDIESDWFLYWCREMKVAPLYHRKLWEFAYVAQALWTAGMMAEGKRGLAFGCGQEPLPSLFAKYGCTVLATDLSLEDQASADWIRTAQHADNAEALRHGDICPDLDRLQNITFRPLDMNHISDDLSGQFDFCWSCCSLEHVGSIDLGLAFIENSLRTLKPGGVAVHTTEFNLKKGRTVETGQTVLFQESHMVALIDRLQAKGLTVAPLNLDVGDQVLDGYVDVPPYEQGSFLVPYFKEFAQLRKSADGYPCTSIGIIIKKP